MIKDHLVVSELEEAVKSKTNSQKGTKESKKLPSHHEKGPSSQNLLHDFMESKIHSSFQKKSIGSFASKPTSQSYMGPASSDDDNDEDIEYEKILQSKLLTAKLIDSVQRESLAKMNLHKKYDDHSFFQDLERFKKNFKETFDPASSTSLMNSNGETYIHEESNEVSQADIDYDEHLDKQVNSLQQQNLQKNSLTKVSDHFIKKPHKNFGQPNYIPMKNSHVEQGFNEEEIEASYLGDQSLGSKLDEESEPIQKDLDINKPYLTSSSVSKKNDKENAETISESSKELNTVLPRDFYTRPGLLTKYNIAKRKFNVMDESIDAKDGLNAEEDNKKQLNEQIEENYGDEKTEVMENHLKETVEHKQEQAGSKEKQAKTLVQHSKSFEAYSYMPSENSFVIMHNVIDVLEYIEKEKNAPKAKVNINNHRSLPSNGFISLVERLENREKNQKLQDTRKEKFLLQKGNTSAFDLEIESNLFMNKEKEKKDYLDSGFNLNEWSASQEVLSKGKQTFVLKHQLSLDPLFESQRQTEEDRVATGGSDARPSFDLEIEPKNFELSNKKDLLGKKAKAINHVRWLSQPKERKDSLSQDHNQSCILPQPCSSQIHHNFRKYRPIIRSSGKKVLASSLEEKQKGDNMKEALNNSHISKFEASPARNANSKKFLIRSRLDTTPPKQLITCEVNRTLEKRWDSKLGLQPPRQKKMSAKAIQLYLCYGEYLRLSKKDSKSRINNSVGKKKPTM